MVGPAGSGLKTGGHALSGEGILNVAELNQTDSHPDLSLGNQLNSAHGRAKEQREKHQRGSAALAGKPSAGLMQLNKHFDAILDGTHEDEFEKKTDVSGSV
jgi:hypothetical protein